MVKMPHWPIPMGYKPIDLELSRVKAILNALDNPQKKLPPVIHIAGTNGKGSTTAFLKSIFQAANYKVHTYTSPHLVEFNERISILGTNIDDNLLYEALEECRFASEKLNIHPTFFEGTTIAAIVAFAKIKADIVLLEVGMGGRLDATNIIDNPIMSIITSISLDHIEFLGETLAKIAYEKAGIIKPNCPCVISQQHPQAMEVLLQVAELNNSQSFVYQYDWIVSADVNKDMIYESQPKNIILPAPSLQGDHQYLNAGNAITAILNLKQFNISDKHIAHGISNSVWPARLQKLLEGTIVSKLPKNWEIWVDGAHNEAAAHVLSIWLDDQPSIPTYMIFGMTKGRNCQQFLSSFIGKIKHLAGVLIEAEPSSYGSEHISSEANKTGIPASNYDSIEEALDSIVKMENSPARIIVCGSLYLAGDILYKNQKRRN
jgi:dihydrofolate synthase/folylpolyglutamate synthase